MRELNEIKAHAVVVDAPSTPLLITPAVVVDAAALQQPGAAAGRSGDASFDADMVIVLAALLCALVCALGLNSLVRCLVLRLRFRRGALATSAAATAPVPAATDTCCGLEKRQLRRIPVVLYDRQAKAGVSTAATDDCAICLGEFDGGDMLRVLPRCCHGFHVQCVDVWLATHSSCPTCRSSLLEEAGGGDDDTGEETAAGGET
ncbi:hypothetical protein BS78_08G019200 [Paspalum vaginatum]|nr:hypothetical protein BS78_08G019200 [Paspalum vaginatum]